MELELLKKEYIQKKKEQYDYFDSVSKLFQQGKVSESEKLEIYRKLNQYKEMVNEAFKKLHRATLKDVPIEREDIEKIEVQFDLDKNFLSSVEFYDEQYKSINLKHLGINPDTYQFQLNLHDLLFIRSDCWEIHPDLIMNGQSLSEKPIYIFCGYYDYSEDCYGPCLGEPDSYLYAMYEDIKNPYHNGIEIEKKKMDEFEDGKLIISTKSNVYSDEVKRIFNEELLNAQNKSILDCINATKKRVVYLSHVRSPEYKEKVLLDKINELYEKVKGTFIRKEVLYSGDFLDIVKEIYRLPNDKIVSKEKISKNGGKNSVIIIAITQNKEYIITFQNRIKDQKIAEFASGYIENGEDPIEAAKRELQEETGYVSDDLFVVDEAFTSPGIDNSITYIVVANNCIQTDDVRKDGTELVNYGLFSELELKYFINTHIMNGAMNRLAYYNLIYNVDDCCISYLDKDRKTYKTIYKKKKENRKVEL